MSGTGGADRDQKAKPVLQPGGLLTAVELAAFLSIPVATVRQWRYMGVGPKAFKVGRHLRYDPAEVMRWLVEECRTETRSA